MSITIVVPEVHQLCSNPDLHLRRPARPSVARVRRACAVAMSTMERARHRRPVLCATSAPAPGFAPSGVPPNRPRGPSERVLLLSQFAAGAISGIANVVLLSPLEVVKVRLQAQARGGTSSATKLPQYTGLGQALRVMLREEGWRSYYRGA